MSHIRSFFTGILFPIFLGLIIAFLLRAFVFQFNTVSGLSMVPTFQDEDYLLTEKISTYFGNIHHGDIVIVDTEADKFIIKRVIGEPGDVLEFVPIDYEGNLEPLIKRNGVILIEDYINETTQIFDYEKVIVEENHYFVMGDNRNQSMDSRYYNSFKKENIIGVVFAELKNDIKLH